MIPSIWILQNPEACQRRTGEPAKQRVLEFHRALPGCEQSGLTSRETLTRLSFLPVGLSLTHPLLMSLDRLKHKAWNLESERCPPAEADREDC